MSDFQVGDFVWFEDADEGSYGYVEENKTTYPGIYVTSIHGGAFIVQEPSNLVLILRGTATDHGAQEYDDVMAAQDLL